MPRLTKQKVLLIGWDGADWDHIHPMLDNGQLPTLSRLIDGGVIGNLSTLQPVLSPMLWNSVATGKFPDKHGILGFVEPDKENGGVRPYSSLSRKTKAIWNICSQNGLRSNVVNWWASHPAEKITGTVVTNLFESTSYDKGKGWMVPPGTFHPCELEKEYGSLRFLPTELTPEHILPFVPLAKQIDQKKDQRLSALAKVLSETITTQSIATALMESKPWDFMAVYFTGIDHFSHAFMKYHPPKMEGVSERDFQVYKDVVQGAYRFHDMMLDRLLQIAGDDTTVVLCSDHGFHSKQFRPQGTPREPAGPAVWHRQYGIVVMNGKELKEDHRIYGARLIDIGPTILSLLDLPVGEDMDGRPLLEAFENPPAVKTVKSWDEIEGSDGMHSKDQIYPKFHSNELMDQFFALGYIDNPRQEQELLASDSQNESNFNLARCLMWQKRFDEAINVLMGLVRRINWEDRFIVTLAECFLGVGDAWKAKSILERAYQMDHLSCSTTLLLYAQCLKEVGLVKKCLRHLRRAARIQPNSPDPFVKAGFVYLRLRKWLLAKKVFSKAIEMDPDNARGYLGLSTATLRQRDYRQAVDAGLRAVGLLHRLPAANRNLGIALARLGEKKKAIIALENAVLFSPEMRSAHRLLFKLKTQLGDSTGAEAHRLKINAVSELTIGKTKQSPLHCYDVPEFPTREERLKTLREKRPVASDPVKKTGKTFVIVSGLPRSGTSMMMQVLKAGGLKILSDGKRLPDQNNPRGYFEWENIKKIAKQPKLLDLYAEDGQAIKVISMLLEHLPKEHDYKVIFMVRPIHQIALSQQKMVESLGKRKQNHNLRYLGASLKQHRESILNFLDTQRNMEYITVKYAETVKLPMNQLDRLAKFLSPKAKIDLKEAIRVVDPALHRVKLDTN